jgi:hypothetical protein
VCRRVGTFRRGWIAPALFVRVRRTHAGRCTEGCWWRLVKLHSGHMDPSAKLRQAAARLSRRRMRCTFVSAALKLSDVWSK